MKSLLLATSLAMTPVSDYVPTIQIPMTEGIKESISIYEKVHVALCKKDQVEAIKCGEEADKELR